LPLVLKLRPDDRAQTGTGGSLLASDAAGPLSAERPAPPPSLKSPLTALLLSLSTTVVPIAVGSGMRAANAKRSAAYDQASLAAIGAGIVIGPSVGHGYTGDYLRASGMALGRMGGLLLFYLALRADGSCEESPCKGSGPVVLGVTAHLAV